MNTLALSKHLLWKDYRQLRPAMVGCWAIIAVILFLVCMAQLIDRRETLMPDTIILVLAAPTLAAMATSGILIGHERQTRSWNWSSSLPIPWTSSLLSQAILWLVSSTIMVGTLYLVYACLMQLCIAVRGAPFEWPYWLNSQIVVITVLVVPLTVFVCFSLAALMWNDTLTAFVVAALGVAGAYVVVSDFVPRLVLGSSQTVDSLAQRLGIFFELLFLVVIAGIFMVRAFRWRWTSGQLASIGWAQRLSAPINSAQRKVIWQSVAWSGGAPSEFRMLLAHGMTSSLGTRALILLGTLVLVAMQKGFAGPSIMLSVLGAGLMGVTVFAGDQKQAAYKFFADRGVHWGKLLAAHALPPMVLSLVPLIITLLIVGREFPQPWLGSLLLIGVALAVFALGVFCSLCSRLALLSICMAVGAFALVVVAISTLESFWNFMAQGIPPIVLGFLLAAEICVMLFSLMLLMRRWLIYDRVMGLGYYVVTLIVAIVPAHVLSMFFCFLAIPNVPWQGLPVSELRTESQLPVVELKRLPLSMTYQIYSTDPTRVDDAIQFGMTTLSSLLGENDETETPGSEVAEPTSAALGESANAWSADRINELRVKLKAMEADLDQWAAGPRVTARDSELDQEIRNTAWLGLYATQQLRDLEMARRAWKVNRQLLTMVDYEVVDRFQHSFHTVDARLTSVLLRMHMTEDDWAFLRTGGSIAELQPEPISREAWIRHVKLTATMWREVARRSNVLVIMFPPMRWYQERLMALLLQQQIQIVSGQPVDRYPNVRQLAFNEYSPIALLLRNEVQLPRK